MSRLFLFSLLLIGFLTPLKAAPKAELWPHWQAHEAANTEGIDHAAWDDLLQDYLFTGADKVYRFDYAAVSEADRKKLDRYLDRLAQVAIRDYNREVQRAYWINLYNALTVREILRFYPLDSIREISSGFFSFGPWDKELIEIESQVLTLNDIEHRILRPIWGDARIHYALNCASIGCPNLQPRAFTAGNSEAMLERGAKDFVNHPRGARLVDGKLQVSSIYVWFIEDFGGDDAGVIRHLQQYATGELASGLEQVRRIDDDSYDWDLNAVGEGGKFTRLSGQGV